MSERSEVLQKLASNPEVLAHKWGISREEILEASASLVLSGLRSGDGEKIEELMSFTISMAAQLTGLSPHHIKTHGETYQASETTRRITYANLKRLIRDRTKS